MPELVMGASAPSLVRLNFGPDNGVAMGTHWDVKDGKGGESVQNDFGLNTLTLFSKNPERFDVHYECRGTPCVN